jgi:hypothetical protein
MEERRFDAWTRMLGAATSRRQVLKSVLGGVLAVVAGRAVEPVVAEAAGACNQRDCQRKVDQFFTNCIEGCAVSGALRGSRDPRTKAYCRANCYVASKALSEQCKHNGGCFGSEGTCCNQQCVDTDTDPNNCGACGHACDPGVACEDGQCQCDELQTLCGTTCVDTSSDNNNCGSCGNACGDCEQCEVGTCQPLTCDSDRFCCQHACYPKCEHNQPDPQTCQCGFCDALEDGTTCGPTSVCCQHDCVDTTCPDGRQFNDNTCRCDCTPVECDPGKTQDPTTCQCVCTPVECPTGQAQDPNTCQCTDKCTNVTCDTCQTCDPDSGQCVSVDAGTSCGGDNICCGGACVAGPTCPDFCADQPLGAPCGAPHYCCGADQQCLNPLDTIGIDNHCCLQGTFWSDADYACVTAIDWCHAIDKGEPCGSEIDGYSKPICCDVGYTCESGACVPE